MAGTSSPHTSLPLAAILLALSCSSVNDINDRAIMAQSDAIQASGPTEFGGVPSWLTPVKTEYRIGSRDLLEIEVYELEEPDQSKLIKTRVSQSGHIVLPLIGRIVAANKTAAELQTEIEVRLRADYLVNPSASVLVAEYRARTVTILGAVNSPGSFSLQENSTTFVDVLALAGGVTEEAGSTAYVVRGPDPTHGEIVADAMSGPDDSLPRVASSTGSTAGVVKIDLVDLMEYGNLSANRVLRDGDFVHIPVAQHYFVTGYVNDPGSFPMRRETTLLSAIATAGGVREDATPSSSVLIRKTSEGRVTIPIDLTQVASGEQPDVEMMPEDVLLVGQSGSDRILRGMGSFFAGLFTITYGMR